MSTEVITFGEIDWNTEVAADKKQNNSKDLWLRLKEGDNEMRLITQPFQYLVHKYKKEGDPGFGQKVSCSSIHGNCPCCDNTDDKAKPRWLLGVISRESGTFKILDISFSVFSQIRKYARNTKSWGDPTKYDINIVVDKNGGATGYYAVQPLPKEPLSAEDQNIRDNADIEDLKRRVTPPTPEFVQKRMDKINGATPTSNNSSNYTTPKKSTPTVSKAPTPTKLVDMSDDEDESFPDYNAK
jgi:hypothetical protein